MQLVQDVTHGKRILDKFLTNNADLFSIKVITSTIKTKQRAVLVNCSPMDDGAEVENKPGRITTSFPDIRAQHVAVLRETLAAYNWNAVLAEGIEVDVAYDTFVSILKGLIKLCIPFKTVTIRDRDPWFVTPLVKSLLRKRNCLFHRGRVDRAELLSIKIGKITNAIRAERFSN